MEITACDAQTLYQTAKNMVRRGSNYLTCDGYTDYFWNDPTPGILLHDGKFHDFYAIKLDTGDICGVLTNDTETTNCLIVSDHKIKLTPHYDLEHAIQSLITDRKRGDAQSWHSLLHLSCSA